MQQIVSQIYNTGIMPLPLMLMVGAILGTVLIINATSLMLKVGYGASFGNIIVIAIVRELGPVLTGFLIAGRSGSSLTTRIASMKVNNEIDALESLGISHIRFLVMPALIGGIIAMLIANCILCLSAIGAGFFITKSINFFLEGFIKAQLDWNTYFFSILAALTPTDFAMGVLKPLAFASIIITNACYYGMRIKNDLRAVPVATSQSVVSSFTFIVVSDLLLSAVYIFGYVQSVRSVI
jgi:phospholipid/cholesterol/gamma-HCH transport system permease protein